MPGEQRLVPPEAATALNTKERSERFNSLATSNGGGCSIDDTALRAISLVQLVIVVEFMSNWSREEVH